MDNSAHLTWTDWVGNQWVITPHWATVNGRAIIVGLDIGSTRNAAGLTQRHLRSVPISLIREQTRDIPPTDPVMLANQPRALTARGEPRKRQPAATGALLAAVARIYLAAVASGDKTPAKSVELRLREAGVPISERSGRTQVRKWIQRARERGLIPPV